ncbi:hypothetical protein FB451DRAFT_1189488 [Mycena latifolia]|nr:hypothetical protein FB451DRAFT_1189488 [Mycena latifolia]
MQAWILTLSSTSHSLARHESVHGPAPLKAPARLACARGRARSTLHAVNRDESAPTAKNERREPRNRAERNRHRAETGLNETISTSASAGRIAWVWVCGARSTNGAREGCAEERLCVRVPCAKKTKGKGGKREEGGRPHQIVHGHRSLQPCTSAAQRRRRVCRPRRAVDERERLEAGGRAERSCAANGARGPTVPGTLRMRELWEGAERWVRMAERTTGSGRWPGREARVEREGVEERERRARWGARGRFLGAGLRRQRGEERTAGVTHRGGH